MNAEDFIRANTVLTHPPLVPELRLHLAAEVVPLWRATEAELEEMGVPPPYWAFAWAGGQALARHLLDHPDLVRGKRVLDFGAGSGLVGLAAARAGAASVTAAEIDRFARAAIAMNARANGWELHATGEDVMGRDDWEVILVGDLCYERPLAEKLLAWLTGLKGRTILLGDPGRSYFPTAGVEKLASYSVATTRDLEDHDRRETGVYRLASA
jgi:predicted nicotinamide N-methyase